MINEHVTATSPPANSKRNLHHRSMCFPACFATSTHPFDVLDDDDGYPPSTPRSPVMPEIKECCRNLISRIGVHRRRRAASADFSYDAYSYALNFEDDAARDEILFRRKLSPPEKATARRSVVDDVILEEDEDRARLSWKKSAPENVQKSQDNIARIGHRGTNRHSLTSADFNY